MYDLSWFFSNHGAWATDNRLLSTMTPIYRTRKSSDEYVVEIDLPGLQRKDLHVTLKDNCVMLTGTWREKEFSYYARIPHSYDKDAVAATLLDGVLTLKVPAIKIETREIIVN